MQTYLVQAPSLRGRIYQGYTFQVMCSSTGGPNATDIKEALIALGFTDTRTLSYCSPGNWIIKKMPNF